MSEAVALAAPARIAPPLRRAWQSLALAVALSLAMVSALSGSAARGVATGSKVDPALVRAASAHPASALHVIVREASPSSAAAENLVRHLGGSVSRELTIIGSFSAILPARALDSLASSSLVTKVWGNGTIHMSGATATALNQLAPNSVWQSVIGLPYRGYDGSGTTVAVLDTGVADVPDLQNRVIASVDLTPAHDGVDYFGHGTHMAGIIAGDGSSSDGQWTGVAPGANLVSIKVAGWDGATDVSEVIAGLQWVYANKSTYGIRVLNLSFGTDSTQSYSIDPLDFAVEKVWKKGVFVVVAAGNRGTTGPGSINKPADDPYVMTVGAADLRNTQDPSDDRVAPFSSRGPTQDGLTKPDVVAPGVTIVSDRAPGSTIDHFYPSARMADGYFKGTGTSQAAAVVSGVAALMFDANPNLTANQAKAIFMGTANQYIGGANSGAGTGLIRAAYAIRMAAWYPYAFGKANQGLTASTGTGSLEASRGSFHVYADLDGDGVPELVQGEVDVLGNAWDAASWAANSWSAVSWNAVSWNAASWNGCSWDAASWNAASWDAVAWDAASWDAASWAGSSWA